MSGFLANPRPERISSVTMTPESGITTLNSTLSIGVHLRTHDNTGLRIIPTKEIMFAINDGHTEKTFGVDPTSARTIAKRLNEFADACESDTGKRVRDVTGEKKED